MLEAASAEASAHYILTVLLGHHWLGRQSLAFGNFKLPLAKRGWKSDDFNRGIGYAIGRGWIEVSTPNSVKLTDAGLAEASEITAEKTRPDGLIRTTSLSIEALRRLISALS